MPSSKVSLTGRLPDGVNGRFWGRCNLPLMRLGFPLAALPTGYGKAVDPVDGYATGVRSVGC